MKINIINISTVLTFVILFSLIWIIYLRYIKIENFSVNPINKIDGVVYINLENREDRKKLIKEEMDKMGIPENKIHKVSGVFIPKNGHKGCVQSHILALQMAKMNNWNTTLILEDDAELNVSPEEFKSKLNEIFNYLKNKEWDVIMIAKSFHINEDLKDTSIIKKIKSSTGGLGYIVKKHYYNKLLDLFIDCNHHMTIDKWGKSGDWEPNALDQRWKKLQKEDNWYGFKKDLLKQRNIWSTIMNKGVGENKREQNIELSHVLSDKDKINLKKGQQKMSDMLKEFDRICRKYNIKYFLIAGSLIGAKLYNGWIPWDGDVDLEVCEYDYPLLEKVIQKELPKYMWFQNNKTDPKYNHRILAKLRHLNTCYTDYPYVGKTSHQGLQIDINIYKEKNGKIYFPDDTKINNLKKNDIYPLKRVPFEDFSVLIMNNPDKYLDYKYGKNWRKYLPVEKRFPHEGRMDPDKTCDFHYDMYPKLYPLNRDVKSVN